MFTYKRIIITLIGVKLSPTKLASFLGAGWCFFVSISLDGRTDGVNYRLNRTSIPHFNCQVRSLELLKYFVYYRRTVEFFVCNVFNCYTWAQPSALNSLI